jgi:hypothetical protein
MSFSARRERSSRFRCACWPLPAARPPRATKREASTPTREVEAKDRLGGAEPTGSTYVGPTLSLSWNTGAGTPIDSTPRPMDVNIDPDTTPDTYVEHRELVRITQPVPPTRIRIGSSTDASIEADVNVGWAAACPR